MASPASEELLRKLHKALALPWATRDFETVIADLRAGKLQAFWDDADEAIILTETCVSPRRRFLNIFLAAGNLKALYRLQPKVVAYARENGITQAQGIMRPEWGPVLSKRGWKKWAEIWHFPVENWDA